MIDEWTTIEGNMDETNTTGISTYADDLRPSAYHHLALGVRYADGAPRRSSSGKVGLGRSHVALGISATVGVDGESRG
jgi:hypothetical protein